MTFGVYIVLIGLIGLVAGPLAQRLLPGHSPMGTVEAIPIGVAVALLGGLIGWYAIHSRIVGFVLAVAATVGLVYIVRQAPPRSAG